jgi:hypothetical protein
LARGDSTHLQASLQGHDTKVYSERTNRDVSLCVKFKLNASLMNWVD